jgi:uroporphyrinogen III methyltransferase/synthase
VLVGAGPGDPDLITVRGAAALGQADVVLYDSLATRELLGLASAHAEKIDVGKRGHDAPTRAQEEINALIVEAATAGKVVVRLKGGDPFVFGRGGEEASACAAAGIPCEIVPGVTAALAAPAYAGIPVTDRRHAASFAVVTGHKDPGRPAEETRWGQLGMAVDTLVILMGMRNLADIVEKLIAGGRVPGTPSAAVMRGTLGTQRVVTAPLSELPARVEEARLGAPATVVVGDVVGLRDEIGWWESEPLFGMRVLVTRAREQSAELASALRSAGAEPVLMPMIALVPPEDPACLARLDEALDALGDYDGLVFASSNGVRFLAARARERGGDLSAFGGQVFCVGQKTAEAALEAGLPVHVVASGRSDAEGLLAQILQAAPAAGRRFLLPRSDIGRTVIADGLRTAGGQVDSVETYRNVAPEVDAAALHHDLAAGTLGALTFTSPSTVEHFDDLLDDPARRSVGDCIVAAVGTTTAAALRARGIEPDVIPKRPDPRSLVEALTAHVRSLREQGTGPASSQSTSGNGPENGDE